MSGRRDLERIAEALEAAAEVLAPFVGQPHRPDRKGGGDPVTEADRRVDELLRRLLPEPGEGWLSEETTDDPSRLSRRRVWVVDPVDGTREFVTGIPEWCVSVGLVEDGEAVAGGIHNPATGETFVGAVGAGLTFNGEVAGPTSRDHLAEALVLASRSEVGRGEWDRFGDAPFHVQPMGSIAYKLARVAAGLADATWTLVPKHEWDVAAGVALVRAGQGAAVLSTGVEPRFNRPIPRLEGIVASGPHLMSRLQELLVSSR